MNRSRNVITCPPDRAAGRERGAHLLKGVPGDWQLYAVDN
jgi:hypothetical protein